MTAFLDLVFLVVAVALTAQLVRLRYRRVVTLRREEIVRLRSRVGAAERLEQELLVLLPTLTPSPDITPEALHAAIIALWRVVDAGEAYLDAQNSYAATKGGGFEALSRSRARFRDALQAVHERQRRAA